MDILGDKKYRILIVDDSAVIRAFIKYNLEKTDDFEILEAEDGEKGLSILEQDSEIECIILDLRMPVMSGWAFLEKFHDSPYQDIPVIVTSAIDNIESMMQSLADGCYDYITKPFNEDILNVVLPLKIKNAVRTYRLNKYVVTKNRQYEKEIGLAKRFQESLLPMEEDQNQLDIDYIYQPFYEVGGDFIDYMYKNDSFFILVADISGHGIVASMVSSLLKFKFRSFFESQKDIGLFIKELNQSLRDIFPDGMFLTCFIAHADLNTDELFYLNCAHPDVIFMNDKEEITPLKSTCTLLGVFETLDLEITTHTFSKGDYLFLYTDGAFEFFIDKKNLFGIENLGNLWSKIAIESPNPEEINKSILNILKKYNRENFSDDILLCTIKKIQ